MKKLLTVLALSTLTMSTGCLLGTPGGGPDGKPFCTENCEVDPDPDPEVDSPELIGAFVSGHLGNYWDCPEEAYQGETQPAPGADSSSSAPAEGDFAACEDGTDSCYAPLNCETAQISIQLSNAGEADATGVLVDLIELRRIDDTVAATLPLHTVTESETGEPFDGTVEVGEKLLLRIEFAGPANPYDLLQVESTDGAPDGDARIGGGGAGSIHTTFSADNHDDITVEGSEIFAVPSVDT